MNNKVLLEKEINRLYDRLSKTDPDTKEYSTVEDNLTKLMDRYHEITKLEVSEAQTEKQMKEERKARWVKNGIDIGLGILPIAVTVWGAIMSFTFEEKGTITSNMGRKFMDKLIKK